MPPAGERKTVCALMRLAGSDDLTTSGAVAMGDRQHALPTAEAVIAEEVERYPGLADQRSVAPFIAALHDRGEQIRLAELARFQRRLATVDGSQAAAVEALTRSIIAKLLDEPTVKIKCAAGTPAGAVLARGLQQLFQLDTYSPFQSGPAEQRSNVIRHRRFVDPANNPHSML